MTDKRINSLVQLSNGGKYRKQEEQSAGTANNTDEDRAHATLKTPAEEKQCTIGFHLYHIGGKKCRDGDKVKSKRRSNHEGCSDELGSSCLLHPRQFPVCECIKLTESCTPREWLSLYVD